MPGVMTHVYIGISAFEKYASKNSFIFGCMYPDVELMLTNEKKRNHGRLIGFFKSLSRISFLKSFSVGVMTHVATDRIMHKEYIEPMSVALARKYNIEKDRAHVLIEFALDKLIIEKLLDSGKYIKMVESYTKAENLYLKMADKLRVDRGIAIKRYLLFNTLAESVHYFAHSWIFSIRKAYSMMKQIKQNYPGARKYSLFKTYRTYRAAKKMLAPVYKGMLTETIEKLKSGSLASLSGIKKMPENK